MARFVMAATLRHVNDGLFVMSPSPTALSRSPVGPHSALKRWTTGAYGPTGGVLFRSARWGNTGRRENSVPPRLSQLSNEDCRECRISLFGENAVRQSHQPSRASYGYVTNGTASRAMHRVRSASK